MSHSNYQKIKKRQHNKSRELATTADLRYYYPDTIVNTYLNMEGQHMPKGATFLELPDEILENICFMLAPKEQLQMSSVSARMHRIICGPVNKLRLTQQLKQQLKWVLNTPTKELFFKQSIYRLKKKSAIPAISSIEDLTASLNPIGLLKIMILLNKLNESLDNYEKNTKNQIKKRSLDANKPSYSSQHALNATTLGFFSIAMYITNSKKINRIKKSSKIKGIIEKSGLLKSLNNPKFWKVFKCQVEHDSSPAASSSFQKVPRAINKLLQH